MSIQDLKKKYVSLIVESKHATSTERELIKSEQIDIIRQINRQLKGLA